MKKIIQSQFYEENLHAVMNDPLCQKLLRMLKVVVKMYYTVYSKFSISGRYMTFENLATFCKDFGLFPSTTTKQSLLQIYQSLLTNNYDEKTFELDQLIKLIGVIAL